MKTKRPAFQFYPGDWLRDVALRACSIGARGLWIDMLCLMHQCPKYGHLQADGNTDFEANLYRIVGASKDDVKTWLDELESAGVFSRNSKKIIYSRRMIRDEKKRNEVNARQLNHRANIPNSKNIRQNVTQLSRVTEPLQEDACHAVVTRDVTQMSHPSSSSSSSSSSPSSSPPISPPSELGLCEGEKREPTREEILRKHDPNEWAVRRGEYTPEFDAFWKSYPLETGKGAAFRAWLALDPDPGLQLAMVDAVEAQERWRGEDERAGRFVPKRCTAANWISDRRWEDKRPDYEGSPPVVLDELPWLNSEPLEDFSGIPKTDEEMQREIDEALARSEKKREANSV